MGHVTFIETCGTVHEAEISNGQSLLHGAAENDIHIMDGVCDGDAACATCHCIVEEEWTNNLAEIGEDEYYMLQSVENQQPNSRLACQIKMKDDLDGMIVVIPTS